MDESLQELDACEDRPESENKFTLSDDVVEDQLSMKFRKQTYRISFV